VLKDSFNRVINYLRISLVDRCNLRCVYCMPLENIRFLPGEELLTSREIELVVQAAVSVGFHKFRLTGGEPTLRSDLIDIVERITKIPGVDDLALTTNGLLMRTLAEPLKRAGLKRINVHLDSLNPEVVRRQMRWGSFERIWEGIAAAEAVGLTPLKLNAVVVRGYNDREVSDLARLTLDHAWHVRFIESMPLGPGKCASVAAQGYVSNRDTRELIERELGTMYELQSEDVSDESRNFRLNGAAGVVGFISPVSDPYCGSCNRMRLTADGKFHMCLLNDDELDVRKLLRRGDSTLSEIGQVLIRAVANKPFGHRLAEGHSTQGRSMFQIGG